MEPPKLDGKPARHQQASTLGVFVAGAGTLFGFVCFCGIFLGRSHWAPVGMAVMLLSLRFDELVARARGLFRGRRGP